MNPRAAFENAPGKGERSERVVNIWRDYNGRWILWQTQPLRAFLRTNRDAPLRCAAILRLAPGDSYIEGGGASPLFKVEVV